MILRSRAAWSCAHAAALLALAACSSAPLDARAPAETQPAVAPESRPPAFTMSWTERDAALGPALEADAQAAALEVERFFGAPFVAPFRVVVHPDRASFDDSFPPEWGIERTECWMVASGVGTGLQLLSPRAWKEEACEHDSADSDHVRRLLAHELVHVYHGQRNPSPDFVDVVGIDWFVEGLATHASGQLESGQLAPARAALASGAGPVALERAWSGKYRYGVCGSLVAYLDRALGRERLCELLVASSNDELLALAGLSESELLERWRADVLAEAR